MKNKNVLSEDLDLLKLVSLRILFGNLFHTEAKAAILKGR